jgi:hypothetical protein
LAGNVRRIVFQTNRPEELKAMEDAGTAAMLEYRRSDLKAQRLFRMFERQSVEPVKFGR